MEVEIENAPFLFLSFPLLLYHSLSLSLSILFLLSLPFLHSSSLQDINTSLVKLLAEDHSPSLVPYITNHDLHLFFKEALEEHKVYYKWMCPDFKELV